MGVESMWEAAWGYWMPGVAWPGLAELASRAAGHAGTSMREQVPGDPGHPGAAHEDMLIYTYLGRQFCERLEGSQF